VLPQRRPPLEDMWESADRLDEASIAAGPQVVELGAALGEACEGGAGA
jgi:hypothetical protein